MILRPFPRQAYCLVLRVRRQLLSLLNGAVMWCLAWTMVS
uniref:Uncharacterized protein n=1 Tax=Arundo donax TaxID=35708 RepID=A0A0A9HZS5_ARUDO